MENKRRGEDASMRLQKEMYPEISGVEKTCGFEKEHMK